jgi:hypothetical protein
VYSKPFSAGSAASSLYRPTKSADAGADDASSEMGSLLDSGTARFKADRGFSGTETGRAELGVRPFIQSQTIHLVSCLDEILHVSL